MNESIKRAVADGLQEAYKSYTEFLERRRTEAAIRLADAVLSTEIGSSEPGTAGPAVVYYAQAKGLIAGADGLHSDFCAALKRVFDAAENAAPKAAVETASSPAPAIKEILATDPARHSEFSS